MKWILIEVYFLKSTSIKKNWENSDIIDKFILEGKGVNVLILTDQYNNNIYILTNKIVLVQFNELHNVWLLDVMQYENCRVTKINMRIPYRNSITRGVIIEGYATRQLYRIKNQYTQVHIETQLQAK